MKTFILAIFAISATGCRTYISPAVKTPESPMANTVKSANGKQLVQVYTPITAAEKLELRDRLSRHQNVMNDVEIVSGDSDEYKCKSDWICTEDTGAWTCYCKAVKVEEP